MRAAFDACGGDLVEAVADLELHVPNELLARAHAARGNVVYRYRFDWEAPVRRACHALDLPFTFGTLDVSTWRDVRGRRRTARPRRRAVRPHAGGVDELRRRRRAAATTPPGRGPPTRSCTLGTDAAIGDDDVARRVALWLGDA